VLAAGRSASVDIMMEIVSDVTFPRLADRIGLTTLPSGSAPSSYCGTDRTAQTAEALVNNWLTECSGAHTMRFEAAR
jgi:hypothetical protein